MKNKKGSVKILDCTLRDGGFVNDWNFGQNVINSIYKRLDFAGIEIIELGFLHDQRVFDPNRSIMPYTSDFERIFTQKDKRAMVVGMIIMGECSIDNVGEKKDSILDGIRVVFKKEKVDEAYQFCKKVKEKGYILFLQPASLTDYSFEEAEAMIQKMNSLNPYAFYMVDTYGFMHKKDLLGYYDVFNKNVPDTAAIGYHSHNNFQLAYSNSLELVQYAKGRDLIIDSTVYGMGKGAGNANTELVAAYLNKNYGKSYDIGQILEIVDLEILQLYEEYGWGYTLNSFLSASGDCHPNYVQFLLDKKVLSIKSIRELLEKIPNSKKTNYDKNTIESLFFEYQNNEINDAEAYDALQKELKSAEKVLILAPGQSLRKQANAIKKYIKENKPVVFAINIIPEAFKADYVFVSNSRRYNQLMYDIIQTDAKIRFITTSNITAADKNKKMVFSFDKLRIDVDGISDNAALLLIKILSNLGKKEIALAGFDGFQADKSNYDGGYNALCDIKDADGHNKKIISYLKTIAKSKLIFVTESKYNA